MRITFQKFFIKQFYVLTKNIGVNKK